MMGNVDWVGETFGAFPEGEIATYNRQAAKAMIRHHLAVVLIEPSDKKPLCTLSARDRKAADDRAQEEARGRGSENWARVRHDCGLHHALTEEKQLNHAMVKKHLESGCNLAISFAHSTRRIIVIDVDTDAERLAFLRDCEGLAEDTPLTVTTPGVYDVAAETWKHKNGGHLYFDVPHDVELPETPGKASWCKCHGFATSERVEQADGSIKYVSCPNAWAAYWGSSYVLVPPSVRKEGPYLVTGGVLPAPTWLTDLLAGAKRETTAGEGGEALNTDDGDSINAWSAATTWADILSADGFTPADIDNCGCPTWTRPGGTHEKSATAHGKGCAKFDTRTGHGPIHFWSDALRIDGRETVSMLTYMAHTRYHGDVKAAMDALGIQRGSSAPWPDLDDLGPVGDEPPLDDFDFGPQERVPAGKGKAPQGGADQKGGNVPPAGDNPTAPTGEDVDTFWTAREVLTHIHTYAQAMYVSPWAMLGSVLSYVAALTPPRVKAMTWAPASLNMYVGLVGESGSGKDTARDAAREWLGEAAGDDRLLQREIGTGQGIVGAYVTRERDPENDSRFISRRVRESVMVTISEIDQITAHARQQASTLVPTLRSAWMAQLLGGLYKDVTKDLSVSPHTYRLCMVVGIQPKKARPLIEDTSGGLPQRFLWMPAIDPTLPEDEDEDPELPDPWGWKPPHKLRGPDDPFTVDGAGDDGGPVDNEVLVAMCDSAMRVLRKERRARARGEMIGDDLATHDNLGRVKVAAALALLEERTEVSEEDWDLAGVVMKVSCSVRSQVVYGLNDEERKRREKERTEAVETEKALEKVRDATSIENAARRIAAVLTRNPGEWQSANPVKKKLSTKSRDCFAEAVDLLVEARRVETREIDGSGRPGMQLRLVTGSGE